MKKLNQLLILPVTVFVLSAALDREQLSLFGGTIGVLVGISISKLAGVFINFVPIVSAGSIILAFSVSVAIGVFFGFYPARKAALLNPIDALRYE